MAEGGFDDRLPDWDDETGNYPGDDDDDNADQTTPFFPNGASTPYQAHAQEEIEMKTFQKKKMIVLELLMSRLLLVEQKILKEGWLI